MAIVFVGSIVGGAAFGAMRGAPPDSQVANATVCADETLHIYATPDIADVLSGLLPSYQRQSEGDCDAVQIIADSSADVVDALARGWDTRLDGPPPDVWIAESTSWLQVLRASDQGAQLLPHDAPSVARSPTVIAMPRPMARTLGWPRAQLGWADLAGLVSEPEGWAAHGREEWGPFRFGMTSPRRSTAAVHALISMGAALHGVWADELSTEGVGEDHVRSNLLRLERAVARTDGTVLEQIAGLRRADDTGDGLTYLSAFPTDERQVWRYNQGLPPGTADDDVRRQEPEVPLIAWYPAEGSLALDYPYVVLNAPWVFESTRKQAADFLTTLQSPQTQERLLELGFRGANGEVTDTFGDVDGISPKRAGQEIPPPEPAVVRHVLNTWDTLSQPTHTLAVIDVSGSMGWPAPGAEDTSRLQVATQAAMQAVSLSSDDSEFGLWEFSTDLDGDRDHRELVPIGYLGENLGSGTRREAVLNALSGMEPRNDTALYETLLAAFEEVHRTYDPHHIANIVLLTDGEQDNPDGDLTLRELKARLAEHVEAERPISLVAIGYGEDADLKVLQELTEMFGGQAYAAHRVEDITHIILRVLTQTAAPMGHDAEDSTEHHPGDEAAT